MNYVSTHAFTSTSGFCLPKDAPGFFHVNELVNHNSDDIVTATTRNHLRPGKREHTEINEYTNGGAGLQTNKAMRYVSKDMANLDACKINVYNQGKKMMCEKMFRQALLL